MLSLTERYIEKQIINDLKKKMVFVGGPRQVGKTTMAKKLLGTEPGYLNWDIAEQREAILKSKWPLSPLWVFDELHKYRKWRSLLKGLFDHFCPHQKILVTGSARLDYYRYGGDSLQGRYHYIRLYPLSVKELHISTEQDLQVLFDLGGFPEPFFSGSVVEAKRWSRAYRERLIQEDILSLENIRDLGTLELLMLRLPHLVGSPLSVQSLVEDCQVSHKTLSNWIEILARLYSIFLISPFGSPLLRAVKKTRKHYHFDWTQIEDKGARFENMVAMHLLKWVHFEVDTLARDLELRYFRDIDGREVDFIITESNKPILAVECKWKEGEVGKGLKYFKNKFPQCEAIQVTMVSSHPYQTKEGIVVCDALKFLNRLV
jgi:uncharacterized protein